jgi:hypothetical protein
VGAITALELELFPVATVYAGSLFWPIEQARRVLRAWREWTDTVPLECESLGRLLQLPDVPFLPEHLRGRSFVLVELAFLGTEAAAQALVRPLRALAPELDTLTMMPASGLSAVNMDPEAPVPYAGEGLLLTEVTAATIDSLVETFVGSSLLHVEMRHLGGAAAERSVGHGLLGAIDEPFLLFTFGLTPDAEVLAAVGRDVLALLERLGPWASERRYLNFAESPMDPRSIYGPGTDRLRRVKAARDPSGLFVANHPV